MFTLESDAVYVVNDYGSGVMIKELIGAIDKVETVRIDTSNVEDITYTFDFDQGMYIEQSRVSRNEPLPSQPPSLQQQIDEMKITLGDFILFGGG